MPIIASTGDTVAVFPFSLYDIVQDEFIRSTRYATSQAIERISAIRSGPSHSVPAADVDSEGFTAKNYDPYK
jgi:hypothetical protein